ncbi:unnamed protein product [Enterobius vermicularis]|uniref:Uncharacterized protein n=1 Tax=Enterobius vermicularis TaxID=51028 RepID=A0A0N4VA65_ENTVE|nr:unnamed protein product [Enterobius vermicularis]
MQRLLTNQTLKPLKVVSQFSRRSSTMDEFGSNGLHWLKQRQAAAKSDPIYRKVFLFICLPALAFGAYRAHVVHEEELERGRPEYIPYEYRAIRTKLLYVTRWFSLCEPQSENLVD